MTTLDWPFMWAIRRSSLRNVGFSSCQRRASSSAASTSASLVPIAIEANRFGVRSVALPEATVRVDVHDAHVPEVDVDEGLVELHEERGSGRTRRAPRRFLPRVRGARGSRRRAARGRPGTTAPRRAPCARPGSPRARSRRARASTRTERRGPPPPARRAPRARPPRRPRAARSRRRARAPPRAYAARPA